MHILTYGELVAVCDVIESKAKLMADAYGIPCFISIEDLLSASVAIDVVVICTPNGIHAQQSILALKNGCHILVEKPMALTSGDCKQMIIAAENSGKQFVSGAIVYFRRTGARSSGIYQGRSLSFGELFCFGSV